MSLLRIKELSKSFGGVHALSDLSFKIYPGTIYSIIGPNGAGKTTLFNLITGLYQPTRGKVWINDVELTGKPSHVLASHGLSRSFQNLQIFMNMSALENVMVGNHLHVNTRLLPTILRLPSITRGDKKCREFAAELMQYVGLDDYITARADSMPYGALKRLEIARALATKPKLLLLDEPAAGLNPQETHAIDRLIRRIAKDGVTVLLIEHDMHLVWGVSDRIMVIDHGRELAVGNAEEIRNNPKVVEAYLGQQAKDR